MSSNLMGERSGIFDMIGPVMIGPSSSHTAGVVRIGRVAKRVLRNIPDEAEITFFNSFARTFEGHGSDRAIIAGLLDYKTDDKRIKDSLSLAEEQGMIFKFKGVANASTYHPNTVKVVISKGDKKAEVRGVSRGGGVISIVEVDGFMAGFTSNMHTLIVKARDRKGSISFITQIISTDDSNIATMTVSRKAKNSTACQIIEMDSGLKPVTIEYLKSLNWVDDVLYIPDIDL